MNKHDIEELQSFLQGEYIEESTSRSLKEVKQHQKDVSSNKDAGDITRARKVLKSKLENDNTNNRYGRYNGKRDVYDKTPAIRDKIRIHLFMKKSECKNSDELYAFNYADKVLSESNKTEVKNKMCRLVGFNPKVYGMDLYEHQPGEYFDINFIENATKQRQIYPTEINKYRYFHFSKTGNLHNVGLSSSRTSRHANGGLIYPSKCIFFYAVEKTADLDNVLARMINGDPRRVRTAFFYGDYVYEYMPKKSDKIYIDSTDDSNLLQLQQKTRGHGFFKVFLNLDGEGRSSVPVKEFNFNISYNKQNIMNQEETKLRSYTARLEDIYDWNPKQADNVVNIFGKYIHDHEANPNSPKPRKELDASLKSLADFYRSAVDKFIDEEKIPQEERRLFKKNAYGHFHKILKTKLNKRFEYGSNDYKMLTKYFHESFIDENVDDDYITESTSRSLKELKQRQQTQNKIKNKNANKSLEQVLRHCFYKSGDSYHFEICPDDFEGNEPVLSFINKLEQFLNAKSDENLNDIHTKTKLFKMLTLVKGRWDPKEFAVYDMNDLMDGIHLKFFHMAKKRDIFNKTGYRFFHLDENGRLTTLNPTTSTSHGGRAVYNQKAVFFYAVREDKLDDMFVKFINQNDTNNKKDNVLKCYGKSVYEYKPKSTDIFYTDNIDGFGERRTKNYLPESTPVFINTDKPLPVTRVDKNIISRLLKSKKMYHNKSDSDVDRWLNHYPAFESYIDETIERFDAFMEEFNNGQIGDSEFIMESAQDNEYAKIVRDYIKKSGRGYFRYKRGEDHLPKEVEDKIFDLAKKIVEFPPNGDYSQYKMYYQSFCRIVNYPLDTVIMGMMINDEHKGYINMGALGGYRGAKRCVLKPGTHLFHSSDNPNLTMINPNHFKGKPNIVEIGDMEIPTGDYDSYYACPRMYFHVEKMGSRQASARGTVKYDSNDMPIIENKPTSGHMYMYIVKPTDRIFFDPELNASGDKDGAVYMLIDKPVRLTKIY